MEELKYKTDSRDGEEKWNKMEYGWRLSDAETELWSDGSLS